MMKNFLKVLLHSKKIVPSVSCVYQFILMGVDIKDAVEKLYAADVYTPLPKEMRMHCALFVESQQL